MSLKPRLSFWQIWNMSFGFLGIQYSFGLQQSAVNPIYSFLGADADKLPYLNLAGPMTGLLIQPLIGALSDKTWSPRWGRRKPYFLVGAIMCSLALFLFPFSSSIWMAAGLLWVLDAGNNTAMEPYRAFVADKLPRNQFATGFMMQSFFTGLGITLANICIYFFEEKNLVPGHTKSGIPYWVFIAFFIGAVCSITTVLWSISKTPEIPPTDEELKKLRAAPKGLLVPLKEIVAAIGDMPKVMWQLAAVYLFQWYAMFCYWQYVSHSVAKSVWHATSKDNPDLYAKAVGWASLLNFTYNAVTFMSAFALAWYAKKIGAKWIHAIAIGLAGVGLLIFPHIENKYLLFLPMIGLGIGWASMMGIPYLLVVDKIPKERYGVYMGIINMMIVVPMLIQTLTFSSVYKLVIGNNPGNALAFAGGCLVIAALLTLRIKGNKPGDITDIPVVTGH
jgi:maltose/moltooligosaccharide transporter